MKLLLVLLVSGFSYSVMAESMTVRYPDYNHSKSGACEDAERHVKLKVSDECPDGVRGEVRTSCIACAKKMRFNQATWTCSGKAKYNCNNKSASQAESDAESSYMDKGIRKMRGKTQTHGQKLGGPCLQFPNSERCNQWKRQYQKAVGGVRN